MEVTVPAGRYVVAVSGGVDSMVLLDVLRRMSGLELVVAHFDHGIRPDSAKDRRLVQTVAARYHLPFTYANGRLGADTSEALARQARYDFLESAKRQARAGDIITAHHRDDVLETALLNLLRGTGRRGLTSLASRPGLLRPLLHTPKEELRSYAGQHHLEWREDSTNRDERYLRNYVRHRLLTRLPESEQERLLGLIEDVRQINTELDGLLDKLLESGPPGQLRRSTITMLPHAAARELLAGWLRTAGLRDFDRATIERLTVSAKTGRPGTSVDAQKGYRLRIGKETLALEAVER